MASVVSQSEDYYKLHPVSAGPFLASIDDSMQCDIDDSDDDLKSSEVDSTTDNDNRKDSDNDTI